VKLLISALLKFVLGVILVGILVFLPAWTINYPNGWLFMGILFIPMFIVGIVLFIKSPFLLEKRLNNKEKQKTQQGVVKLSGLMFLGGFIVSSLDFRFGWSKVPVWVVIVAVGLFLIGYVMYAFVLKQNAYLSRTIKVETNQKVISTGLYSIVRHPMYFATLLMFLPMPLILGSFYGLIAFALYPLIIVIRILNEEEVLSSELDGYKEYQDKVKYRLIPFIW
jgi:protein-S-isoprenylcysteine O-methyltransferase Ste14